MQQLLFTENDGNQAAAIAVHWHQLRISIARPWRQALNAAGLLLHGRELLIE